MESSSSPSKSKVERRRELQRRSRRKQGLIDKAYAMSMVCDAEIFVGIRIRETGKVTTFCTDPHGLWSSSMSNLKLYHPLPVHNTPDDLRKRKEAEEQAINGNKNTEAKEDWIQESEK